MKMNDSRFGLIPADKIIPSAHNPRKRFSQEGLDGLAESIKENGLGQPILVRPLKDTKTRKDCVEIVAGERRWRACKLAGLEAVPCMYIDLTDVQAREWQLLENLQREDVNEIEEAEGYQALMNDHGHTADQLVAKFGVSRAYIYGRLKLCALPTEARTAVYEGKMVASIAELIGRMPSVHQVQATEEIVRNEMTFRDAADHIRRRYMLELVNASFPINDTKLLPKAGSCDKCPKRTGNAPDLFHDIKSADVCTDPDCFQEKGAAHTLRFLDAARKKGIPVHTDEEEAQDVLDNDELTAGDCEAYQFDRFVNDEMQQKTVEELLAEEQLPKAAAIVSIDGKAVTMYENKALQAALEKAGICRTEAAHRKWLQEQMDERMAKHAAGKPDEKSDANLAQQMKALQAEQHTKFRNQLYRAFRGTSGAGLSDAGMRAAIMIIAEENYVESAIKSEFYPEELHDSEALVKHVATAPMEFLQLLLLDLAFSSNLRIQAWNISADNDPGDDPPFTALETAAVEAGVDVDAIRKEAFPAATNTEEKPRKGAGKKDVKSSPTAKPAKSGKAPAKPIDPAAAWPFPTGTRP